MDQDSCSRKNFPEGHSSECSKKLRNVVVASFPFACNSELTRDDREKNQIVIHGILYKNCCKGWDIVDATHPKLARNNDSNTSSCLKYLKLLQLNLLESPCPRNSLAMITNAEKKLLECLSWLWSAVPLLPIPTTDERMQDEKSNCHFAWNLYKKLRKGWDIVEETNPKLAHNDDSNTSSCLS